MKRTKWTYNTYIFSFKIVHTATMKLNRNKSLSISKEKSMTISSLSNLLINYLINVEKQSIKISGKKSIPREQPNQNKEIKIATSAISSLFMKDNEKCNISHAPSTGLSSIQFSMLNVLESLIPKDQKNIPTLRWWRHFIDELYEFPKPYAFPL